jgi:hypothetical protein
MTGGSSSSGRGGLQEGLFEASPLLHCAVEASIDGVSTALEAAGRFLTGKLRGRRLQIERDVFGNPCSEVWPFAVLFQAEGLTWTQLAADLRRVRGLELGRFLSRELDTRCVCIEVTDDAYGSHALFDRGMTEELYLLTMNLDMKRTLGALDVDVPAEFADLDPADLDQIDEAEHRFCRRGPPASDAAELAARAGCYFFIPTIGERVHRVGDLTAESLVRMDAVWIDEP